MPVPSSSHAQARTPGNRHRPGVRHQLQPAVHHPRGYEPGRGPMGCRILNCRSAICPATPGYRQTSVPSQKRRNRAIALGRH